MSPGRVNKLTPRHLEQWVESLEQWVESLEWSTRAMAPTPSGPLNGV